MCCLLSPNLQNHVFNYLKLSNTSHFTTPAWVLLHSFVYVDRYNGILVHAHLEPLACGVLGPDHLVHLCREAIRLDGVQRLMADDNVVLLVWYICVSDSLVDPL